ncbi:hypothetical protein [Streptomyces thermolineatus]|uniref:hypothetical protein n=1 Tax=Streptomyces thermolineatus TaxID=44033 RepID=UPI00385043F0
MGFGRRAGGGHLYGGGSPGRGPGAAAGRGTGRADAFFALVRSWAVGIVVLLLCSVFATLAVFEPLATAQRLESLGWRVFLLHLPAVVGSGLAALAAARVHPEPFRSSPGGHLLACLAVPLGSLVFSLVTSWEVLLPEGIWLSTLAVLAGCLAAVAADLALDRRHDRQAV